MGACLGALSIPYARLVIFEAIGEEKMLDILMLVLGVGMFAFLLGYVAICDKI